MKQKIINDLNDVAREIRERIQAYADLHKISFAEAQKRARINIDGKRYQLSEDEYETQNDFDDDGSGQS